MTKEKTASQLLKETFSTAYNKWMEYCEWVIGNWLLFDLLEDRVDYKDHYLPEMDLRMRF